MYCIDELSNWQYEHRDHKQATKRNLTPRICIYFKTSTWKSLVNPWRALSTHVKTGRTEAKTFRATILDKMKWNSKPPSPPNQGWRRAKSKNAPFSHPWFEGEGGLGFPFILSKIAILDKMKWNSKPPSPPNQGWRRAKSKNAPFSHPWFEGEGGLGFPFILSKIVASKNICVDCVAMVRLVNS